MRICMMQRAGRQPDVRGTALGREGQRELPAVPGLLDPGHVQRQISNRQVHDRPLNQEALLAIQTAHEKRAVRA